MVRFLSRAKPLPQKQAQAPTSKSVMGTRRGNNKEVFMGVLRVFGCACNLVLPNRISVLLGTWCRILLNSPTNPSDRFWILLIFRAEIIGIAKNEHFL